MPSQEHEVLVDLFRSDPSLALLLLRATGVDVADARSRLVDSTFPVTSPDYHVDLAVVCDDGSGAPSLVVLVEVQLEVDADKHRSWPLYQAAARARFKCDACVLVVAIRDRVAAWASVPVALGPGGSVFRAIVLGPDAVPRAVSAATPELAVLSALAHGADEPDAISIAVASFKDIERRRAQAYFDLLRYHLGEALDRALEAIMATSERRWLSDWANKLYDDGVTIRARADLLTVITARGIVLSEQDRETIDACADVAVLDAWLARAARAASATEIFAGSPG